MKVFLDANILFAIALPKSRTGAFFAEFQKRAALITSVYAVEEAGRNLSEKRPDALPYFEQLLKRVKVTNVASATLDIKLASKDLPILGGAIATGATHLLTGDSRDFGALFGKKIRGVKIVSPQMLAAEVAKKGWLQRKKP